MNVESPTASGFDVLWIDGGGVAIPTDNTPNQTPPAANRIFLMPRYIFALGLGFTPAVNCFVADGTQATVRIWQYDDSQATWFAIGNVSATLSYSAQNFSNTQCRCVSGAKFFCQVVSNTGVTKIACTIR